MPFVAVSIFYCIKLKKIVYLTLFSDQKKTLNIENFKHLLKYLILISNYRHLQEKISLRIYIVLFKNSMTRKAKFSN